MKVEKTKCEGQDCHSAYQDKQYGKGKRVFNLSLDGKKGKCTVCGREQSFQK